MRTWKKIFGGQIKTQKERRDEGKERRGEPHEQMEKRRGGTFLNNLALVSPTNFPCTKKQLADFSRNSPPKRWWGRVFSKTNVPTTSSSIVGRLDNFLPRRVKWANDTSKERKLSGAVD